MTVLVLPDTTVVRNFALLHRMDLLEDLVGSRAAWCGTVATECDAQARLPELGDMALARRIFGLPWMPSDAEHIEVTMLRERLASPGDGRYTHLGEAETIVLASRRSPGAVFVTDDRSAVEIALSYNVTAVTTAERRPIRPAGTGRCRDLVAAHPERSRTLPRGSRGCEPDHRQHFADLSTDAVLCPTAGTRWRLTSPEEMTGPTGEGAGQC